MRKRSLMVNFLKYKISVALIALTVVTSLAMAEELEDLSIYHLPAHWQDQDGNTLNLSDLKGNVVVAVMVYTSCKMACPVLIGEMKNIEASVKKQVTGNIKYVLVSIDPQRDTPERLKQVSNDYGLIGKQWLLLRGNTETTREFANLLAVKYKQISPEDFSHSNIISVFDRQGKLVHQREGLNVDRAETINKIIEVLKQGLP